MDQSTQKLVLDLVRSSTGHVLTSLKEEERNGTLDGTLETNLQVLQEFVTNLICLELKESHNLYIPFNDVDLLRSVKSEFDSVRRSLENTG
jgi:hypothetical protein